MKNVFFDPTKMIQKRRIKRYLKDLIEKNKIPNGITLSEQGIHPDQDCTSHQILEIQEWMHKNENLQIEENMIDKIKGFVSDFQDILVENGAVIRDRSSKEIIRFKI